MSGIYPSVKKLSCPYCGKKEFKIIGTKGAVGSAIGGSMFGAVGNMVASSASKKDFEIKPIRYQCLGCRKKFEAVPQAADEDELLASPCTVTLRRLSSFVGMAVSQQVFLNGVKIGNVKNNSEITFKTYTKHNVVFITDQYGVAFPGSYTFTAADGGSENINFKRKFS